MIRAMNVVVICFQISIFESLKTAESMLLNNFQQITKMFRKRKMTVFNNKSRLPWRDLLF